MRAIVVRVFGLALFAALVVGCGGADFGPDDQCDVAIMFTPSAPLTNMEVRASSIVVNAPGVLTYDWHITQGGMTVPFSDALPAHEDIAFTPLTAGTYHVTLAVTGSVSCPVATGDLNVTDGGAGSLKVRLHVTPPPDLDVPPIDKRLVIPGGGDLDISPVTLDPGVRGSGSVTLGGTGLAAYLRLAPAGMPDAVVETFSSASGAFSARLRDEPHEVLVIPTDATLAPGRFAAWNPGDPAMQLPAGDTLAGVVRDGAGNGLGNAKVQLVIDGVPSAIGTTTGTGAFTLHAATVPGVPATVIVTPPAGSGLPRLEATDTFSLSQQIVIRYAAFPIRDLGGVHIRRGGVAQPGAKVSFVGTDTGGGTVTVGAVVASATAVVRVTATADGTGQLPATLVPGLPVAAVVAVAPGDLAVTPLALGTTVPTDITAPAMVPFSTRGLSPTTGTGIDGVTLDLVPRAELADAGAPVLHFVGTATGAITGQLASGGHYDARWSDRDSGSAPRVDLDVTATNLAGAYTLPRALFLTGELAVPGSANPVPRAAVQVLCRDCVGVDHDRPIAETSSDALGTFAIALPDPGPM